MLPGPPLSRWAGLWVLGLVMLSGRNTEVWERQAEPHIRFSVRAFYLPMTRISPGQACAWRRGVVMGPPGEVGDGNCQETKGWWWWRWCVCLLGVWDEGTVGTAHLADLGDTHLEMLWEPVQQCLG